MEKLFIPVILGTARQGNRSQHAARFIFEGVTNAGIDSEVLTPSDFAQMRTLEAGADDENSKKWAEIMSRADGLIVVAPEYNHGYPGELKMLLDRAYGEYNRKPLGICGVSAGRLGSARMVEQLRLVAIELQMVPVRNAVYFSDIMSLFDEQGNMKQEHQEGYQMRFQKMLDELVWYAKALKVARNPNQ